MHRICYILLICCSTWASAQRNPSPSDSVYVKGKIRREFSFSAAELLQMEGRKIDDVRITNHKGELKTVARGLKGVLLKDLLAHAEWDTLKPKDLSEFYFVCRATDGYKVVFSWNEIFNTPTGNHIYIITERDGKKLSDMDDRILLLSTSDFQTGRRHVRALKFIEVKRAD